ncbi:uncharacterized protein LOC126966882 isoform X2 [Leptidea sinapis]|uniref:uncharacterized protein LOC126966882 isoform X2 n=1 Tax=Leptidea sinapis TaxID=189913 RepID=UPI0021C47E3E|nr:uncharacterized protein LOC126966882 isoform X2 [Leptidea sinapis]
MSPGYTCSLPQVDNCCGCVQDISTATAIIAVLGIVTNPLVSWAIVRHAYVIHVSFVISTNSSRSDIVDINLNNVLSFGFGSNAGVGSTCLTEQNSANLVKKESTLINFIKYFGWVVVVADAFFLMSSINLLLKMNKKYPVTADILIISAFITLITTLPYTILIMIQEQYTECKWYHSQLFHLLLYFAMWCYFILVVNSYSDEMSNNN